MNSDSTTAAGETGKPEKGAKSAPDRNSIDLRPVLLALAKLEAEVASLRAENAQIKALAAAGAHSAEEAAAYMRILLPEQYLALKADEVLQLHEKTPDARLKLTADFATPMVAMRRGEILEAGDPRVKLYGDRMQLALVTGGQETADRVGELVAQANARAVQALLNDKRREQQKIADELAAKARDAAERAAKLAEEAA